MVHHHLEVPLSMSSPDLLTPRQTYKPFLYQQAYDFWQKQQQSHWLPSEVSMNGDIQDWNFHLSPEEKNVVAGTLKGFIQTELVVEDYWTQKVARWFPHPEIQMMAATFGAFESIHTVAYAFLNDTLGIEDYDAFLREPTAKAKIDRLINTESSVETKETIARSLAIFSAFTEGVSLFSSFAVLFNFSRFNKLKGVGQIIAWSINDEAVMHSEAGCWLFREFIKENPEIWTDEFKKTLYEAARETVALEDDFIDKVFELGPVQGLDPRDLKQFIRHRANIKLGDIGLKQNWKNIDKKSVSNMNWFEILSTGTSQQDFFAGRETKYTKGLVVFDDGIFEDNSENEESEQLAT